MVSYKEMARDLSLADGQSVVVLFDPLADVGVSTGQRGGRTYEFHVLTVEPMPRPAILKGGKRLFEAISDAVPITSGPVRIKVTAVGEANTLARTYKVVRT